jgi:large subunit ribosomal protein L19e
MNLSSKKKMAAHLLNVGKNRVKFDPEASDELLDAITRDSIKGLVRNDIIWVEPKKGISRGRVKIRKTKERKRGKGKGSKEGSKGARRGKKTIWINKVRAQRNRIKILRDRGEISSDVFHDIYKKIKGGQIRSIKHLETLIKGQR